MRLNSRRWAWLSGTVVAGLLALIGSAPLANAQATRTWVSGLGDDVYPCSRTAPCLTWQGAMSKTAIGGEIDALDPGDFGSVTITKAVTLDGTSNLASIQATVSSAVTVSVGANERVVLRGLTLNGNGSSPNGVQFITGKQLVIENTAIGGFIANGIDFEPAAGGQLEVSNADIRNNTGSGILAASSGGVAQVSIESSRFEDNAVGVNTQTNGRLTVRGSMLANNTTGLQATSNSEVDVESSQFYLNVTGVLASGQATVRLSNATIENNTTGSQTDPGATLTSFFNNRIAGNGNDPPLPTVTPTVTVTSTPTSTPTATSPPSQSQGSSPKKPTSTPTPGLDRGGGGAGGGAPAGGAPPPDNNQPGPAPMPIQPAPLIVPPPGPIGPISPVVPLIPPVVPPPLPLSLGVPSTSVAIDPFAGASVALSDGNLVIGVPPNADGTPLSAAILDIEPIASPWDLPPPNGTLRLMDIVFSVALFDADGAPAGGLVSIALRPTQGVADLVGGDLSQLVIGFLDEQGNWQTLPTTLGPDQMLSAVAPGPGTFGVLRSAPTFWVVGLADSELGGLGALEVIAVDGSMYLVRLADGSTEWIDASLVMGVPAPDALPPAPPPAEPAAAGLTPGR